MHSKPHGENNRAAAIQVRIKAIHLGELSGIAATGKR